MATTPDRAKVAGIVLAAGQSSRLGRPKQLLEIGGPTVIRRVTETALVASLDAVVVVLGSSARDVAAVLTGLDVTTVLNRDFASGQSTSMRAGLRALGPEVDAALFLLGDQPTITPKIIDAVLAIYRETGAPIVQARYRGASGHPVLLGRTLFPELDDVTGDRGARQVIQRNAELVRYLELDQDAPPDIDTEADYARVLGMFSDC